MNENLKYQSNIDGNREVLLKVEDLKQFFKLGRNKLKAIHNISFEIYKGEVFGLVGESGCGKTTTGRSIIKLYDITSGSIYFKNQRICAGTRWNEKEIKFSKIRARAKVAEYRKFERLEIKDLKSARNETLEEKLGEVVTDSALVDEVKVDIKKGYSNSVSQIKAKYRNLINCENEKLNAIVTEQTRLIKSAKYDHKNCDKVYQEKEMKRVTKQYEDMLKLLREQKAKAASNNDIEKEAEINNQIKVTLNEYNTAYKIARNDRIMTKMQMIFQDPIASLNPRMTVREIIAEGLIIQGVKDKNYIDEKVYEVLEMVGLLPEHATRYPHEFSGGQRQRIGIARAIIMEPELIIADEPISALDVSIQAQVINLLNDLRERMGLTIMFIAHDLSVVKYFCDRIAVMYFGKIVELASSDELFENPLHPYTKSLLSAIPLPDPHYEKQRKRISYNPVREHDYSKEAPILREIKPGHLIYCNSEEFEKYLTELK